MPPLELRERRDTTISDGAIDLDGQDLLAVSPLLIQACFEQEDRVHLIRTECSPPIVAELGLIKGVRSSQIPGIDRPDLATKQWFDPQIDAAWHSGRRLHEQQIVDLDAVHVGSVHQTLGDIRSPLKLRVLAVDVEVHISADHQVVSGTSSELHLAKLLE